MEWGVDKRGSNPQTYMVKALGRFDPYNPISYIFCHKIVLMFYNDTQIYLGFLFNILKTINENER